jgi:type IV secretion system protein VirB4
MYRRNCAVEHRAPDFLVQGLLTMTATHAGDPINKTIWPAGLWKNFVLSHAGSLIGGLEMSGIDPKGLSEEDLDNATVVLRNLIQTQHAETVVTQYYWHYEGAKVALKARANPRSKMLSERREAFLNEERNLSTSRLYWLLDVPTEANLNSVFSASAFKMVLAAPFEQRARSALKAKFSNWGAWLVEQEELRRQVELLDGSLSELDAKLQILSPENTVLSSAQLWAQCRAAINLQPEYLDTAQTEAIPSDDWDRLLADGDIHPVMVDGLDCLKIDGPEPVYARIASIVGYGADQVPEGMWGRGDSMPVLQKGNYLVVTRARPLSSIEKALMLSGKENELHRSQLKFSSLLKGDDAASEIEKKINDSALLKRKVTELEEAANSPDRYYHYHSHVIVFDRDPKKLRNACRLMNTALTQSKFKPVWESAGMLDLFPMLMPGYPKRCFRSAEFTSSQVGACSLVFKSSEGIRHWGEEKEEAIYILESDDGTPFHYTPFIGDKCLVLGVGPTRSGKTYFKNVVAGHFLKYGVEAREATEADPARAAMGSFYHAIDVDPGTEPLALFFKDEGGIFRIENPETDRGFNPFVAAHGENDGHFTHHILSQIRIMLSLNDSEEMRRIEQHEQQEMDRAIKAVLRLPAQLQNMTSLYNHVSTGLKQKLSRWVRGGMYGNLFDNVEDGIGGLNKRVAAYNLAGVKDKPELAQLVTNEIFYRVIQLFEDPKYRSVPKMLAIDEAQYLFGIPGAVETAVAKARTWFKHNGGMEFWTQSVEHYMAIPEWNTLRSSASTWIFMADQNMDAKIYKKGFGLKDGECEAIARLIPRKQAYIIQREAGISTTVNINTAKEEHVIATSRPHEAIIVRDMLDKYPDIDMAVAEMVKRIFKQGEIS